MANRTDRREKILHQVSGLIAERFAVDADRALEEKRDYKEKLEKARGEDVFKYIVLTNLSALEESIAQTRMQAERSFLLSTRVAIAGFIVIGLGIVVGIISGFFEAAEIRAAYLASGAGILIEFVSGVFFYLYNRTLQQVNLIHDKLIDFQKFAMSILGSNQIGDDGKRDEAIAELSKLLISEAFKERKP